MNASIADNQGQGTITDPVAAGHVLISEFRVRGALAANDVFVEIYNNSDATVSIGGFVLAPMGNTSLRLCPSQSPTFGQARTFQRVVTIY